MADEQSPTQGVNQNLTNIADALHTIFLAGVGAIAATGEKSSDLFNQLVAKGEDTVKQGAKANDELLKKAKSTVSDTAEGALRSYMERLSPEDRAAFVAQVQKAADEAEAADADAEQEAAAEEVADDIAASEGVADEE